jgi:hypothetical protein
MASLSITAANVAFVEGTPMSLQTSKCDVAITAGVLVRMDATTGKWIKGDGNDAAGFKYYLACTSADDEATLTCYRDCIVDLGRGVLDSASFGVPVYASDTAGEITLTAGESSSTIIIGYVVVQWSGATANRLLRIVG